jgi:hypothetical protein
MALFNYATKEITIKIVYYGPGLSGKTTNLQYLHSVLNPGTRGKLLSLATEADRTLFFDFLPIELGKINDFSIRFQLYTVPGQVRYNATRKLVLKGADAVVFVADSQREMKEQNIESLKNMSENLIANNIKPEDIPILMQYNKRDLPNILSVDELNKDLNNDGKYEYRESVAIEGTGVEDTFQYITRLVIKNISQRHKIDVKIPEKAAEPVMEEKVPEYVLESEPVHEEPIEAASVIEAIYESPVAEHTIDTIPEIKREPIQPVFEEEEAEKPREVIIKEIKEVPVFSDEKLDKIADAIQEVLKELKELKSIVSGGQSAVNDLKQVLSASRSELNEMKREQKEIFDSLRDINKNFDKLKMKKSWFKFL